MTTNQITKKQMTDWVLLTLRESAWAPLTVFVLYLIGIFLGLYDRFPPLDIPTHFFGGVAMTYFFRSAIRNSQDILGEIPYPIQVLFAFTCTATIIIFWEFLENILDYVFNAHNVLGLKDTLKDMVNGLLGAFVFTIFYRRR